jgi:hypothetical protein
MAKELTATQEAADLEAQLGAETATLDQLAAERLALTKPPVDRAALAKRLPALDRDIAVAQATAEGLQQRIDELRPAVEIERERARIDAHRESCAAAVEASTTFVKHAQRGDALVAQLADWARDHFQGEQRARLNDHARDLAGRLATGQGDNRYLGMSQVRSPASGEIDGSEAVASAVLKLIAATGLNIPGVIVSGFLDHGHTFEHAARRNAQRLARALHQPDPEG